jgi:hypothetical protein
MPEISRRDVLRPGAVGPYLSGQVDDFRIYQRGLSPADVMDLFHARSQTA